MNRDLLASIVFAAGGFVFFILNVPAYEAIADAKAKAATMGEGVEFVASQPIKTATHEGLKATYEFKDITKLKLGTQPKPQGGPAGAAPGGGAGGDVITFKFAKQAGGAVVTAVFAEKKPQAAAKKEDEAAQDMQLAMMKQFLKGLKISVAVVPDGTVTKTSSAFREGNKVTLMEMDLDEVMKDDANFKKLSSTQNMNTAEAAKALAGVPGLKMNPSNEVTIEFSGK